MQEDFRSWAKTPPMGWNSWDCFGGSVTEAELRANIDYMAEKMANFGWEYIVVDIAWYNPEQKGENGQPAPMIMDEWGRFLPASNRFPSATKGAGFKPLADYCHKKGLKFGIHAMRGIPRQAVMLNTPILNSKYHAADIADRTSLCHWNGDMFGIDTTKPGAQDYLNSLLNLWAEWGVDYIKIDDASHGMKGVYYRGEIEGYRKAIDQCGRRIVFSLSPGPSPRKEIAHLRANANLFRISFDVWDNWWQLRGQFYLCSWWARYIQEGNWPDADMLPFGHIRVHAPRHGEGPSSFSQDEQKTMMTLYVMFKSPLMFGGHMPDNDAFLLDLLTNSDVLQMHKDSIENRALYNRPCSAAWTAKDRASNDRFIAFFNFWKHKSLPMTIRSTTLGLPPTFDVKDLWTHQNLGTYNQKFTIQVPPHGVILLRLSPKKE